MTSRERVFAAVNHQAPDRPPYIIDLTAEAWENLRPLAGEQGQAEFIDNDVLDISVPWWQWHELGADWHGPLPPASFGRILGAGSYDGLADNLKAWRDQSDKYFLVRLYGIHFEKAYFARGFENFMADLGGEKDFARKLLRRIIDRNLVMIENFIALPEIDGVLLGSDWGSQRGLLMSLDTWDDLIRPGEQAMFDLVRGNGKHIWVHSCGDVERLIPTLIEMGLQVLNPVQPECMDLQHLKQAYGDRLAFWGGISTQQTLPYGSPGQVREEARRVRDVLGANGGYIFSPSQSLQGDVPVANVLALLEVAREAAEG
jgi:uroporphyrinogen decarboxylase